MISDAGKAIITLAEKLRAPVVNTLLGKGAVDESHPLHLGMLGMHGTAYANKAVADCDLIMSIGARWDDRITGKLDEFCTDAVKIHIDIDPSEFDKIVQPDVWILGDARLVIEDLLPLIEMAQTEAWLAQCNALAQAVPAQISEEGRPARAARARPAERDHPGRRDHHHRRRPAPDVGRAVLPRAHQPPLDHERRRGHDGLRLARRDRRRVRATRARRSGPSSATAASR